VRTRAPANQGQLVPIEFAQECVTMSDRALRICVRGGATEEQSWGGSTTCQEA
jgi:hypothetical protein